MVQNILGKSGSISKWGRMFHDEMDRCSESQGRTKACSRMPERDAKAQGEDSPKQAGSCWFARHCLVATSGASVYPPGVWFADVIMSSFSGVIIMFVLFRFHPYAFIEAAALRSIVLRYTRAPTATRVSSLEIPLFPSIFAPIAVFSLYGEYVVRFSLPDGVFLPCDHGLFFISTNYVKNQSNYEPNFSLWRFCIQQGTPGFGQKSTGTSRFWPPLPIKFHTMYTAASRIAYIINCSNT